MKKLSNKTIAGLVLTSGLVAVGAFMLVVNTNGPTDAYMNQASNKETLTYTEKTIAEANKDLELAEEKVETANKEVEKAEKAEKTAEKELEEAEALLNSATTKEEKAIAQSKVAEATKAKEEAHNKVEAAVKVAEQAAEDKKAAEEVQKKVVAKEAEQNSITISNKEEDTKTKNTVTQETKEQEETEEKSTNAIDVVVNAAKKTQNANSLTVYDITNKWSKKYNKNDGNELITYYSGSAASNGKAGVLYSYTSTANNTQQQKSLFKPMETTLWAIPSASSIKGNSKEWEMQFSGKRTVGVPELELLKKGIKDATVYKTAASLVTKSANELLQNVTYYKVTISEKDVIDWLKTYYNVNDATALNNDKVQSVEVIVGVANGYVTYISNVNNNNLKGFEIMVGANGKFTSGKYLKFEVVLNGANKTSVPALDAVGLDANSVEKLEEEYKAHYGCKKEWTSSEKYGEYYYWVCKP